MLTRNLTNNQARKIIGLAGNRSSAIFDISDMLCNRIGSYGGCNGLFYSQKEVAELVYAFWRIGNGYEMEAVVNEICDMWYAKGNNCCGRKPS